MLNVLLIDDEYIVLKGIEAILNSQHEVDVHVMPMIDSVQALDAIPSIKPDVIILDICMPELDGLSFIERAQRNGFSGGFIIISGYEDSTYLRRAFELHVLDYIIKPLNHHRLLETLRNVDADNMRTRQALLSQLQLLLSMPISENTIIPQEVDCGKLFTDEYMALICSFAKAPIEEETQRLSIWFSNVFSFTHGDICVYLCCFSHPLSYDDLSTIVEKSGLIKGTYGIGKPVKNPEAFPWTSKESVHNLLFEAEYDGIQSALPYEGRHAESHDAYYPYAATYISKESNNIKREYNKLMHMNANRDAAFRQGFVEIMACLFLRSGQVCTPDRLNAFYNEMIDESRRGQDAASVLTQLPEHFMAFLRKCGEKPLQYTPKINEAIAYIQSHYMEDISLNKIAGMVGLSLSYFSATFSQDVGMSFVAYLTKTRMQMARMLLERDTSLSVEEISRRVGYQTVGHFYRVFKSTYQISPHAWRLQHRQ